jgi:hypothetical protein
MTKPNDKRRVQLPGDMGCRVPWEKWWGGVEPFDPKVSETSGWPPVPRERILRTDFLQLGFNPSDPGVEESFSESVSTREFAKIDLGEEGAPNTTRACTFRYLFERHRLGKNPNRREASTTLSNLFLVRRRLLVT